MDLVTSPHLHSATIAAVEWAKKRATLTVSGAEISRP